jgi:hypothetical protein
VTYARKRAQIGKKQDEEIGLYALSPLYRHMTRTKLAEMLQKVVAWPGKPPEIEVLERKISEHRNISPGLEDQLWSLGESIRLGYDIPADTTRILLESWKYSLEIGYPLTVRHARWIARLHKVIVTTGNDRDDERWKQIQILFFTALRYSDRERVSESRPGRPGQFDTAIEDANLIIPFDEALILGTFGISPTPWPLDITKNEVDDGIERRAGITLYDVVKTGEVLMLERYGASPTPSPNETPKNADKKGKEQGMERRAIRTLYDVLRTDDLNVVKVVHILHYPRRMYEDESDWMAFIKFSRKYLDIEKKVASLSVEQQRAFAILVTCFSTGPKWNDLSPEDYFEIIGKFAQLVSRHNKLWRIFGLVVVDKKNAFAPYYEKVGLVPPMSNKEQELRGET